MFVNSKGKMVARLPQTVQSAHFVENASGWCIEVAGSKERYLSPGYESKDAALGEVKGLPAELRESLTAECAYAVEEPVAAPKTKRARKLAAMSATLEPSPEKTKRAESKPDDAQTLVASNGTVIETTRAARRNERIKLRRQNLTATVLRDGETVADALARLTAKSA